MKQQVKPIIDIDEFDQSVSLWQLLPCGNGHGLKMLKYIVDSVLNSQKAQNNISILLTGKQGKRTHGRAFLRAVGIEDINEIPAELLRPTSGVMSFFDNANVNQGYLISDIEKISQFVQTNIYEILSKREFCLHNYTKKGNDKFAVPSSLILTSKDKKCMPTYIPANVDYVIELEEYTEQQLELIVLQRVKYCHVDYENEDILKFIVGQGENDLHKIIKLLKTAIVIMQAECRKTLTLTDVKKALLHI